MEEKKDKLQILQERFRLEGMTGDQSEAARIAQLTPPNVSTGLSKKCWDDLTKGERKAMIALLRVLDKRKQEEAELEAEFLN